MPQVRHGDEVRTATLWDGIEEQHQMTVFVARYMHQPLSELEELSTNELRAYFETVKALVMMELGVKSPTDKTIDGDWE